MMNDNNLMLRSPHLISIDEIYIMKF